MLISVFLLCAGTWRKTVPSNQLLVGYIYTTLFLYHNTENYRDGHMGTL